MEFIMRFKPIWLIIFLSFFFSFTAIAQKAPLELVESVPDETTLDNDDIRNTGEVWRELISAATSSISIEAFYFTTMKGEPLEPVLDEIRAAAARGVTVRIISDSKFYKTYPQPLDTLNALPNIEVRIINFGKLSDGVMHAKYFIVDDTIAFLGSQNFDWRSIKHIHELGIVIRVPSIARVYKQIFDADWEFATGGNRSAAMDVLRQDGFTFPVTVSRSEGRDVEAAPTCSPSGWIPDESLWDETAIIRIIDQAEKEIFIQVMNYSAQGHDRKTYYERIENALRRAAARSVKVKMIVADWSTGKPKIDYLKSLAVLPNIDVRISTIPQHSSGHINFARVEHCKYMVADGRACWIGTSNWEKDYFYSSRNVGIVISGESFCRRVAEIFKKGWESEYVKALRPESRYTPPKRDDGSGQ